MFGRLVPPAVFVAAVVGCAQPPAPPPPATGGGDAAAPGADPNAAYTIKLREKQAGDKFDVTESTTQSVNTTVKLPAGDQKKTDSFETRAEYTETIVEAAPGAPPTKLTRLYKLAERPGTKGQPINAFHHGKTVTIEKKGDAYTFKADGKDIPDPDAQPFRDEFGKARKARPEELLPKAPVKLNETWTPEPALLKDIAESMKQFPINPNRSKMSGKLTRVYPKDGKQFGVIEVRTELSVEGKGLAGPTGTFTVETILDTPIDGSSTGGTVRVNSTGTLNTRQNNTDIQLVIDAKQERTATGAWTARSRSGRR